MSRSDTASPIPVPDPVAGPREQIPPERVEALRIGPFLLPGVAQVPLELRRGHCHRELRLDERPPDEERLEEADWARLKFARSWVQAERDAGSRTGRLQGTP